MNKIKTISAIAIGLFLINIFWIWFFISHKPAHGRHEQPKKVIIEKLQLDKRQIKDYEVLIKAHRANIHQTEANIQALKNQLYLTLKEKENMVFTDSLIAEIAKVQMEIEHIHYNHFKEIKQLCKPQQQHLFNALCSDIARLFAHPSPPVHEK